MTLQGAGSRVRGIFLDGLRPYAWIFFLAFLLYVKTISFGFCFFDDQELIVQNEEFLAQPSNIFRAFSQMVYPDNTVTPYYRPVLIVSFMLDYLIGGAGPSVYHLTNILIHIAVSFLIFSLFVDTGIRRGLSLFFALAFTAHPALSQAVAWVPGRNDSLLALFTISSLIAFIRFVDSRKAIHYLLHLMALGAALFTKESAVVMIPLYYVYIALVRGPAKLKGRWRILLAGQAAVLVLWVAMRYYATRLSGPVSICELCGLILPQLPALLQLAGKAVFPVHQSVFPVMNGQTCAYGLAVTALLAIFFVKSERKDRGMILFGLAWFAAFLLPPLLRPHAGAIKDVLEHRLYLPMAGLMMALAFSWPIKRSSAHKAAILTGVAILAALSLKTFFYIDSFRSGIAFWEDAVKNSPRSAFCRLKLGKVLYRNDRIDEARAEIEKAVELDLFASIDAHYYLGHIWLKKGALDKAEKEFRKATALMPDNEWAYMSLGVVCYRTGRPDEARRCWERSLEIRPDNAESLRNLAIYHAEMKDYAKAGDYAGRLRSLGVAVPDDFMKKITSK